MSLAMTAASIDDNPPVIIKKENRTNHNKTQKNLFTSKKVNEVIQSIHNNLGKDDETEQQTMGEYQPINPMNPGELTKFKTPSPDSRNNINQEGLTNFSSQVDNRYYLSQQPQSPQQDTATIYNQSPPTSSNDENMKMQELNRVHMNEAQARQYYQKLSANYQPQLRSMMTSSNTTSSSALDTNQLLMDKLNYVIHLLEENKDERTNHVAEEVVLYSFLGIFMIFIVDSFSRVGKYVR